MSFSRTKLCGEWMMEKIVVVIMGQNCEKFIKMSLESVKGADAIVYCDGGSTNKFWYNGSLVEKFRKIDIIENKYDQEDKAMNGKQRNFYLDYVKENYPDYWCLAIDADEVVDDLSKIKKLIQGKDAVYNVNMRHFIGDLGHEDSTQERHYVLHRLFKINQAIKYPEVEHPVLEIRSPAILTNCTTIWHLAYIPNLFNSGVLTSLIVCTNSSINLPISLGVLFKKSLSSYSSQSSISVGLNVICRPYSLCFCVIPLILITSPFLISKLINLGFQQSAEISPVLSPNCNCK